MASAAPAGQDSDVRQLGACIAAEMARLHVPGVAVGVLHEGREFCGGYGVTSVENPLPVDPDTLFQIGSTTKTYTGTAAMRLVEQGKLDLDAPVRTYLPDLRLSDEGVAAGVTLRHLLQHTAGWAGDYFADTGAGDDALAQMLGRLAELEQLTPLGETWSYNNAGFYLAGRVIEAVTGQTYEAAVKELIFDPLGMTMSYFFPHEVLTHRFAVGHTVEEDVPKVVRRWALHRAVNPAGGITSTVKDQLVYARFHLGDGAAPDGARLLSPESMALMQSPLVPAGSLFGATGITWLVRDVGGVRTVRHGGTTNGQLSAFVLVPARGFALTVLTNANRGGELHGNVVKWALERYLGLADPAPEPLTPSAEELAAYAGRYTTLTSELTLTVGDDGLVLQATPKAGVLDKDAPPPPAPPPTRLALLADERVVALDPPYKESRGEFLRGLDGRIAWFRFGGRVAKREG